MLKVFLDESGIHSGAEVCVVAGYANSARRWKVFEQLWKQRLNKAGLLEFKAARFFRRNSDGSGCGDYHGWKREELIALFNDLVAIINKTKPLLIGSVLAVNDFLQLSKDEREYLTGGRW
ncbi:MAG TPA: hypothetical protein VMZ25_06025, partial [Terriglobales bacterium]|nr:hypothetical protein [Terriglobales bacterium]